MHDIVDALNIIERAVAGREGYVDPWGGYTSFPLMIGARCRRSLTGECWHLLGTSDSTLQDLGPLSVQSLYETGSLPLDMTFGAMVVYRAVQLVEDGVKGCDRSWGRAFEVAIHTAGRYFDLAPDAVVASVAAPELMVTP